MHYSPRGDDIVSTAYDGFIKIWDLKTKKTILNLKNNDNHPSSSSYNSDGTKLISAYSNNSITVFDLSNKNKIVGANINTPYKDNKDEQIIQVEFHPTKKNLAIIAFKSYFILLLDLEKNLQRQ